MDDERNINNNFSPQDFVDQLLKEGSQISCDDQNNNFYDCNQLPKFFNEELYKKGQQFFHKHIYAMFFCKLTGLITILSVPTILKLLIMTKMSGSNMTAYKRYMSTILHMMIWYDDDLKPKSRAWESIAKVRRLHNYVSKKGCTSALNHISQADMALTQFGFMGMALARSSKMGIHKATEKEWMAFLHVWRVVGKLMGIEDRFNLCSGTVEDTRQICNILIQQVFTPQMEEKTKDFIKMTRYLCDGMWCIYPLLQYETTMVYLHGLMTLKDNIDIVKSIYFKLTWWQEYLYRVIIYLSYMLRYDWFRIYKNYTFYTILWIAKNMPLLAIFNFGFYDSYINIKI